MRQWNIPKRNSKSGYVVLNLIFMESHSCLTNNLVVIAFQTGPCEDDGLYCCRCWVSFCQRFNRNTLGGHYLISKQQLIWVIFSSDISQIPWYQCVHPPTPCADIERLWTSCPTPLHGATRSSGHGNFVCVFVIYFDEIIENSMDSVLMETRPSDIS